jgi:hypothetical protein
MLIEKMSAGCNEPGKAVQPSCERSGVPKLAGVNGTYVHVQIARLLDLIGVENLVIAQTLLLSYWAGFA